AETDLAEREIDGIEGYRGSAPVRTGNGAFCQTQLDVYGAVLDWALLYRELGGRIGRKQAGMLRTVADGALRRWCEPEHGIWEMRGPRRHHVHGKIMSWVALDRAGRLLGADPALEAAKRAIATAVGEQGRSPEGWLRQAFGEDGIDASALTVPLLGYPLDRRVVEATVAAVERRLRRGDYVYRYHGPDGLPGDEGAFLICSFWLVDALLSLDRPQEARKLFERLLACANDVGLYAEEIDPASGEFLGNFPQAFTHLALVGAAFHLDLYERKGARALAGCHADRARRHIRATLGWRALWAFFRATGRAGRLLPSWRSVLRRGLCR
ncbi:MAG TPA: glycoside hydrolase family 15 protein, partial [Pelomicrobium sp.]|nr:glycoside hydrolase family 15 protein [Pelomicrobium sp.]